MVLIRACRGASALTVIFYCFKYDLETIGQVLNVLKQCVGYLGTFLVCSYTLLLK